MKVKTTRNFTLADAIVLVAATAVAMAGCRFWAGHDDWAGRYDWATVWNARDNNLAVRLWIAAQHLVPYATIALTWWTLAVLALRVGVSRPRRRILWGQPGFLACVATLLAVAWNSLRVVYFIGVSFLKMRPPDLDSNKPIDMHHYIIIWLLSPTFVPYAEFGGSIVLVWFVVWAGRRCRAEPSWIDRAGRLLGASWIAVSLISVVMF